MKVVGLMIFDFDGTLVNSGKDLVSSVNYTLDKLSLPVLPAEKIISFIGDGVQKLMERSLGGFYPEYFDEAMQIFDLYYREHLLDETEVYPGVEEVLNSFRDKKKVILTNKLHSFTVAITDALKLTDYFDEIIGADSRPYRKPDRRLIDPLLDLYGVPPEQVVVVGDGINDVLLAKNAGLISCAFLNGLGSREELLSLQPDIVCESLPEMMDFFC
ncbi:MAG: Phosphoglycolate phosphatase [Syntrophus sp. PtaU1.Bin208]|nr:MAG: Phosphoglycolate phosphatase [Syntrophus sp. PtaU1.Bin208]